MSIDSQWGRMSRRNKYKALTEERRAYLKQLHDPEFRRLIEQIRQERRGSR